MSANIITQLNLPVDNRGVQFAEVKTTNQKLDSYDFKIYTINVKPCDDHGNVITNKRKARHVTDDSFYQTHPEHHRLFPRSYSILEISRAGQIVDYVYLQGFYKFTGLTEIDDDDTTVCQGLQPPDLDQRYTHVLETEKANGKNTVMTLFQLANKYYLFGGSKNVHRVVGLSSFQKDMTDEVVTSSPLVVSLLNIFYRQYQGLTKTEQQKLKTLLAVQHHTLSGEYLDGLHMVAEPRDTILWFGLIDTKCHASDSAKQTSKSQSPSQSLTGNIYQNLKKLTSLGLPTVEFKFLDKSEFTRDNYHQTRYGRGREGLVRHYLVVDHQKDDVGGSGSGGGDQQYTTIFVEKYKLIWYVVIRMLRQIILNAQAPYNLTTLSSRIHKTLLNRNAFLKLPTPMLVIWHGLCVKFCEWFIAKEYQKHVVGIDATSRGMGTVWEEFLSENPGTTDDFGPSELEIQQRGISNLNFTNTLQKKILVIFQGIPGLGKTTIARYLVEKMDEDWTSLEQDSFTGSNTGKQCLKRLEELLTDDKYTTILLSRNNANVKQYHQYASLATELGWKTLVLTPQELNSTPDAKKYLLEVCRHTVLERTGHASFDILDAKKRLSIVSMFLGQFKSAAQNETIHFVEGLRWLQPNSHTITDLGSRRKSLEDLASDIKYYCQQYREASPEPQYIGIGIDTDMRERLVTLIRREMPNLDTKSTNSYLHHLTLMHSSNKVSFRQHWDKLLTMVNIPVKLIITGLALKYDDYAILTTQVVDEGDHDISSLVLSGHPHITGILPKTKPATYSIEFLQDQQMDRQVTFKTPIIFQSKISYF